MSSKERRNFKADFDRLVTDLKASPSSSSETIIQSKPSTTTTKRPALRFHEAEDAGDSRFVQQWDKAIDALLAGTDAGSDAIKSDSFEAIKEFLKLESTKDSGQMISDSMQQASNNKAVDQSNTTATATTCAGTKSSPVVESNETRKQIETGREPAYDTDQDENATLSTASTDRGVVVELNRSDSEDENDDEMERNELDRMLDQVKVLKESLGTQDAVLLQVLQSGPSAGNQRQITIKPYHLFSIAAICVLLLSILIAFIKLSGS